ncbi:MAG: phosphoglycerate kinase [Desulfovibrionales bacterium]
MKMKLNDIKVNEKTVLVRVDFNVPVENGMVEDDSRIKAALPTIQYLIDQKAKVVLCSHLGRPKGKPEKQYSLRPVAEHLSRLLDKTVFFVEECTGPKAEEAKASLEPGRVLLLENTRFDSGEKENDPDFAASLAKQVDVFVNDAFGTAHRAHASTVGVTKYVPYAVSGLLMQKELDVLESIRAKPERPFVAVLGGVKIADKIGVIKTLLSKAETLCIGGAMANNFYRVQGYETGDSVVDEHSLDTAKEILHISGKHLVLPVDVVIADSFSAEAKTQVVSPDQVKKGWQILDIGPRTIDLFKGNLEKAKLAMWNGPLGAFEMEPFAHGTMAIARIMAQIDARTVIGGGDSLLAVKKAGVGDRISHVSTGGGAFLTFMEGKELHGVAALSDQEKETV